MIAVVSVGFTTTLLISKGLRTVKQQVSFQDTQGITAEVVAIFVPLLQQSAGKLWPGTEQISLVSTSHQYTPNGSCTVCLSCALSLTTKRLSETRKFRSEEIPLCTLHVGQERKHFKLFGG